MVYHRLKSFIVTNYEQISMSHPSSWNPKANLDVEIYFTKVGHMVLESWQLYLEVFFLISREKR